MAISSRKYMSIGCAAAALLVGGLLAAQPADATTTRLDPTGAVRFYDDAGQDRGYTWCNNAGSNLRCDYYTREQCVSAGYPNNNCTINPWAYHVRVPPQRLRLN